MAQRLIQQQEQRQQTVQRLSQQQMLQVRLLEMPLTELEDNINAELDDNPALETQLPDEAPAACDEAAPAGEADTDEADFDTMSERQERDEALNEALEGIGRDDEMPTAAYTADRDMNAEQEEIVYGDTLSFYDKLRQQVSESNLDDQQRDIMEYVIGSLDDDGLLRKTDDAIADELAIYHGVDCTEQEVAQVVATLQTFDPAGIGARSLRECLLLQIDRRPEGRMKSLMQEVVAHHFEAFTRKHWDKIKEALAIGDEAADLVRDELRRLNPKPGAALGEAEGRNMQQITPDFLVETDETGHVSFTLNSGNVPELKVSPSFADLVDTYKKSRATMTRRDKEALLYAKEKVERAQGFIDAVRQRRHTLCVTMQAIIDWQIKFFRDGDEADLRPMILQNIADRTGLDKSTISRVSNIKYAQTNWGTFPLRFFFSDSYATKQGEELSTRRIKIALKEIIDAEDKTRPMSDDALMKALAAKGFSIARRTVSKYREQLGLPVARLRK